MLSKKKNEKVVKKLIKIVVYGNNWYIFLFFEWLVILLILSNDFVNILFKWDFIINCIKFCIIVIIICILNIGNEKKLYYFIFLYICR